MSYIGTAPKDTFTTGLVDRFTSTTGTTVTLTHEISSKNDIIVFVNFVKQDSTNYSVGGTGNKTLTLGGTLVSSDIVEVHYLNKVFGTQQPSANSVGVTELNLSEGTSGQALTTNGSGTLSFSSVASTNGITMVDHWRVTSSFTLNSPTDITSNLARFSGDGYGGIGTGMTESSGVFTFPSTGIYYVTMKAIGRGNSQASNFVGCSIRTTTDGGSNYSNFSFANNDTAYGASHFSAFTQAVIDVTDTSQVKVLFRYDSDNSSIFDNDATQGYTQMTFIRLGDT